MAEHITGMIVAPHTPMHADGSVNLDLIQKQAELFARNGLAGVFICGTTGEGMSLTAAERMAVAERWTAEAAADLRVIVHVGTTCLRDCKTLAEHARKIGAWGVGTMGPCFFRPLSVEDLAGFCAEIAASAGELPLYYYHMPVMTGVQFTMRSFLAAAGPRIPTLAGVKYTYEDLMDLGLCMEMDGGRFDMLFGRDEILLSALALGVRGAIGSTFNYAAPLYRRLFSAYEAGDMPAAQALQRKAMALVEALRMAPGQEIASGKAAMKLLGLDCGPVRSPLRSLSAAQSAAYEAALEGIGFDDFRCRV